VSSSLYYSSEGTETVLPSDHDPRHVPYVRLSKMRGTLVLNSFISLALAARQKYDVETTNGKIMGHLAPGMNSTIEFLGVPYAQPPVGQLRFAEPLPPREKSSYIASDWV
jgi:hypothetical protein